MNVPGFSCYVAMVALPRNITPDRKGLANFTVAMTTKLFQGTVEALLAIENPSVLHIPHTNAKPCQTTPSVFLCSESEREKK